MEMKPSQAELRAAQQAWAAPREKRIQLFQDKVEACEEQHKHFGSSFFRGPPTCSRSKPCRPRARYEDLAPISISDLQLGVVHKGRVLHCTTVVKCGLWSAVATLVEDSARTLSNFAVYNVPNVVTFRDAQEWLPEGTRFAIVEPYFKTRGDGTPGIRVDDPSDIIFDAELSASVWPAGRNSPPGSDKFQIGARITVCGLQSEAGRLLNGLQGTILSYDEQAGRLAVDVDRVGRKAFKSQNVIHCDGGTPKGDVDVGHGGPPPERTTEEQRRKNKKKKNKKKQNSSGGGPPEPTQETAPTTTVPNTSCQRFLAPATRVEIVGLTSDAGITLNGQEGTVEDHDLTSGRVRVKLAKVGMKALKPENMKVLHAARASLPRPWAEVPSIVQLCEQGRFVEAVVLGQCRDNAFISHTMHPLVRIGLFQRSSESECDAAVQIIRAMVEAASEAQRRDLSTGPKTFHEPSSLLKLCDNAINSSPTEDTVPLLFLRGTIWSSMHDYHASAADFRAAYVASAGACPWILLRAGWTAASSNDGVPPATILQNDAEAQLMYEVLRQHLADQKDNSPQELHALQVFCSWELAQVLLWRQSRALVLEGKLPLPPTPDFKDSIFRLKDQALKAERNIQGVMNSLARDMVLRFCSFFQGPLAEPDDTQTPSVASRSGSDRQDVRQAAWEAGGECLFPNLDAYIEMEDSELRRMKEHADARRADDFLKSSALMFGEHTKNHMAAERSFLERRKVLDSRAEQLASQEKAFKQREAQLHEQAQAVKHKAARLQGDEEGLGELYKREKQRQAEEFKAQLSQVTQQYEDEITSIQSQLKEISRQREEEHRALLEGKRLAEKALEEVVGANEAEVDRWQRELRDREDQISSEQVSLRSQAQQLAQMQADLSERARVLEDRDRVLRIERKAQQELRGDGALSHQFLGEQRSGDRQMRLHDIRFSQDSIRSVFSDGRSTEQLTKDLQSGKMSIADFPTIRVVELCGIVWSLDNRRLRCMQTAFAKERKKVIDVQVESLKQDNVKKEFLRKFTAGKDIAQRKPRHDRA
eukprot:TRINITY_DN100938_c0_g1_i1.p1 TRINITY_DN100938_c0_g1~~TRINITY_DN100938_c0_g1_i1.p1  ORF type:complete len:1044 (-),score=146.46 TRINITY_DN100938_c0_g1_i1:60-3191(-)